MLMMQPEHEEYCYHHYLASLYLPQHGVAHLRTKEDMNRIIYRYSLKIYYRVNS